MQKGKLNNYDLRPSACCSSVLDIIVFSSGSILQQATALALVWGSLLLTLPISLAEACGLG